MITEEMKRVLERVICKHSESTCVDLNNLNTKFFRCMLPTTLAALIVAMVSAPDTESDADMHIRHKLVEDAWSHLVSDMGLYESLRMMQPHHTPVVAYKFKD